MNNNLAKFMTPLALSLLLFGCSQAETKTLTPEKDATDISQSTKPVPVTVAEIEDHYKSLNQIVNDSDLVAEVKVTGDGDDITYKHASFVTHQLKIRDVVVGNDALENQSIKLLEIGLSPSDLNIVKSNSKYLLFLKKYEGPILDNAYVVTGVYQGKFKINNEDLKYSGTLVQGVDYFQSKFVKEHKVNVAKQKIKEEKQKDKTK